MKSNFIFGLMFLLTTIFFFILSLAYPKTVLALICGGYPIQCYETCGTCSLPNPGICAKSGVCPDPNCGSGSTGCCPIADAKGEYWVKYSAHCVDKGFSMCDYIWIYDTKICSTGDKCISGETGLRAGFCDCSYGGTYKYCCTSSGDPEACTTAGEIQDGTWPDEGQCPGGYLIDGDRVRSTACSGPSGATPLPNSTPIPVITSSPEQPSGTGACGEDFHDGDCSCGASHCQRVSWGVYPNGNCGSGGCYSIAWYQTACPPGNPEQPSLSLPANGALVTGDNITFSWFRYANNSKWSWNCYDWRDPDTGRPIFVENRIYEVFITQVPNLTAAQAAQKNPADWGNPIFRFSGSPDTLANGENGMTSNKVTKLLNLASKPLGTYYWFIRARNGWHFSSSYDGVSNSEMRSFTKTQPITCTASVNGTQNAIVSKGVNFTVNLTSIGNSDGDLTRLYLERADNTKLAQTPVGATYTPYDVYNYYNIFSTTTNGAGISLTNNSFGADLPSGEYYLHCDLPNEGDYIKCSGNPFCKPPPDIGVLGPINCTPKWVSCSDTDRAAFCIKGFPDKATLVSPSSGTHFYSFSPPIDFSWNALTAAQMGEGCPSGGRYYKAYLATKLDFSDQVEICSNGWTTGKTSCNPYSMTGKPYGTYYWRVDTTNSDQITHSDPGTFTYTENPLAWFQTTDGDIHANDSVTSSMPSCSGTDYLSLNGGGGSPGVVSWGEGDSIGVGSGKVSETNWQAKTGSIVTQISYEYLINRLKVDQTTPQCLIETGDCSIPSTGTYFVNNDVTITGRVIGSNEKVVIFVNGNVHVPGNITVAEGGFFALITKGDITFDSTANQAHGFYLSDGAVTVAAGSNLFSGQGSFVGLGEVIFSRNLANNCTPAESFSSRPDLFINAPLEFQYSSFLFQEVAP